MDILKIILIICCFILITIALMIGILLIISHFKNINKITKERHNVISQFHGYKRRTQFDHITDEKDKLILEVLDCIEDALLFNNELCCCNAGKYYDFLSE